MSKGNYSPVKNQLSSHQQLSSHLQLRNQLTTRWQLMSEMSEQCQISSPVPVTYIRVTGNSKEIPILNSNCSVVLLTQVNEGESI